MNTPEWNSPEDVPETVVERLHEWLHAGNPEDAATRGEHAVADVIRAFFPVPPKNISEELREWPGKTDVSVISNESWDELEALADRVAELEKERDDAQTKAAELEKERDVVRSEDDNWKMQRDGEKERNSLARNSLAEARAEVEQLKGEMNAISQALNPDRKPMPAAPSRSEPGAPGRAHVPISPRRAQNAGKGVPGHHRPGRVGRTAGRHHRSAREWRDVPEDGESVAPGGPLAARRPLFHSLPLP